MSWHSNVADWKKLCGKRVLIIDRLRALLNLTGFPLEAVVLEVSSSGRYVKLRFNSTERWVRADEYVVVDVLE